MTPELRARLENRLELLKKAPLTGCGCGCHKRQREASIKNIEAKLVGSFFHCYEDCYCCLPTFGFNKE